ncbi:hypothetical protein JKP88DRAFT_347016 [Tribonema minus]|uniref:DUF4139 domain-containing protein n=1 Tax=Tribonema minus TaxID=303371 RepID=A0A836CA38_9STRA|nr:hypothetical protein JKP88DRAFT_347016 [Tribonema minus]
MVTLPAERAGAAKTEIIKIADAPISKVTVYKSDRAEVTRQVHFEPDEPGIYELKVRGLPHTTESDSVRLEGTGHCTILHVSYAEEHIEPDDDADAKATSDVAAQVKQLEETIQRGGERGRDSHRAFSRSRSGSRGSSWSRHCGDRRAPTGAHAQAWNVDMAQGICAAFRAQYKKAPTLPTRQAFAEARAAPAHEAAQIPFAMSTFQACACAPTRCADITAPPHCAAKSPSVNPSPLLDAMLVVSARDGGACRIAATSEDLTDRLAAAASHHRRSEALQSLVCQYAGVVVGGAASPAANAAAGASATVPAAAPAPPPPLDAFDAVLAYTRKHLEGADDERAGIEKQRRALNAELASAQERLNKLRFAAAPRGGGGAAFVRQIVVSLDVAQAGAVDLVARYVTCGARWTSSYDVRVATAHNAISRKRGGGWTSCLRSYDVRVVTAHNAISRVYYGEVVQGTGEDWDDVRLTLSTAEPAISGTPPALAPKTVRWRAPSRRPAMMMMKTRAMPAAMDMAPGAETYGWSPTTPAFAAAPLPPPPPAPVATAAVDSGGALGAVAYEIAAPASVASDFTAKKLTVGILELSADVTHYVVPALEAAAYLKAAAYLNAAAYLKVRAAREALPLAKRHVSHYVVPALEAAANLKVAAYLKAKVLNTTDYLLLASDDVSIFFDNRFVTKTSLRTVSPGEGFDVFLGVDPAVKVSGSTDARARVDAGVDVFLGIDPAVKVSYAPPRKTTRRRGLLSKTQLVTHAHCTTLNNAKAVPITVALVDAVPRSSEDLIKVMLKDPAPNTVTDVSVDANEALVSAALELLEGEGGGGGSSAAAAAAAAAGTLRVVQNESGKLVWIVRVPPHTDARVPFEYSIEWPADKNIEMD